MPDPSTPRNAPVPPSPSTWHACLERLPVAAAALGADGTVAAANAMFERVARRIELPSRCERDTDRIVEVEIGSDCYAYRIAYLAGPPGTGDLLLIEDVTDLVFDRGLGTDHCAGGLSVAPFVTAESIGCTPAVEAVVEALWHPTVAVACASDRIVAANLHAAGLDAVALGAVVTRIDRPHGPAVRVGMAAAEYALAAESAPIFGERILVLIAPRPDAARHLPTAPDGEFLPPVVGVA
ncbi:MAG: hypothetical protein D6705_11870 [Deltaproteobacteria bacterium]|nr:MAG: hypothetical protein D6705_11870 [Deltaproteobacteria bacterium]